MRAPSRLCETTQCRARRVRAAAALVGLLIGAASVQAQVVPVPPSPQIGSSNPVTAEPPVPRPHTSPCVVQLFQNLLFADFNPKTFNYTPPVGCPAPWAKVVFTADFTVTAGRQFDRTAAFYLDHANIYYGTTAEPRSTLSPSWHVERDVTDLSAIFAAPQTGEANIGNFVGVSGGVTYNGLIYANAALEFYPAGGDDAPAPRAPDIVVPVNGSGGDAGTLSTTASVITQTLELPRNVERAYLDVIAQSQSNDEFWYFCVPNDQAGNLLSCGSTAFRETEVTIDGQPAGVAPVYPWIYTGGIDPYLWEPVPGVQTLDFRPYRVDLTPFAGLLADGNPHTLAVSVYNADSYFLATANLLVFTDHGAQRVSGGVLGNTLAATPSPVVSEDIRAHADGTYTGSIAVSSRRDFTITGYVETSHGRVTTTVDQSVDFRNTQQFDVNPGTSNPDIQNAQQLTTVESRVTTTEGFRVSIRERHLRYPLTLTYSFVGDGSGGFAQTTTSEQRDIERESVDGVELGSLNNEVKAADTLTFDAAFQVTGHSGSLTTQRYRALSPDGCFSRTLSAQAQQLVSVTDSPRDCMQ
jgi:hypothetical protein